MAPPSFEPIEYTFEGPWQPPMRARPSAFDAVTGPLQLKSSSKPAAPPVRGLVPISVITPSGRLGTVVPSTQGIYSLNSTSRFFKLPPELRNRIYGLLMGGKVIHINDLHEDNTTPKATICGRPQDYEDLPEECKILLLQPQHSYGWKTLQRCHVRCYQKQAPRKAINLNLTLVSRQFHHETALIPFAENHFVISCPFNSIRWSFPTFLDSLNSLQVGNITRLSLHCYVGLPEKGYFDCLLRMKHLKHISLIVKNTIMCRVSNSPEGLGFEFPQKLKADVELDRLRLSQLPVTSARCYMEVTVRFAEPKPDERATTIFNEWQRETEAIILGSTDKFVQLEAAMET